MQKLFMYVNSFVDAEPNDLDVLVCDEAHRLHKTSANRYTKSELRTGRPQVAELIDAALVPVFLLDQHQVVRPGEMGTKPEIQRAADAQGLERVRRSVGPRCAARAPVGHRPGRIRPGRLRLHRAGLRVRLVGRDLRPRSGLAYSTDPETRDKLRSLVSPAPGAEAIALV
ncbi:hypothetical protein M2283_006146 [Streptomyces pseudovenezuelae]|uniref:Schlafen group 3-like DNA/RNA helicase domain-containing protein n=1 Tax=Streptomyces pseudovenezuelae TaxID=67350 RepID=A0ABT6LR58_9ACTN|nr:hypothetical protein [Streptomyces pseudovenezuelae]